MAGGVLSVGLDLVVLVFLGITIYYAINLSRSLNNFRGYRAEFDKLLDELTRNVGDAQRALHNLKITSGDAGKNLDKMVRESKTLLSELQIVNESGRALAERLEGLVDKNRPRAKALEPVPKEAFSIRDPDMGAVSASPAGWDEDENEDIPEYLQSQAEQELYKALRKGRKQSGGRA